VAGWYDEALAGLRGVRRPVAPPPRAHTYQSYVVLLDEDVDRDGVIAALRSDGIETTLGTYALHAQPFFQRAYGYAIGDLPRSHRAFTGSLALPLFAAMSEDEVAIVAEALARTLAA
jgi:dTDP-4-amino-4,6-dideoxygalactose transaminase